MALPVPVLKAGYERLIRPVLFASYGGDPEAIHERMIELLAGPGSDPRLQAVLRRLVATAGRPTQVAGIRFASRVGLAAGLDKDASAVLAWRGLGFGFTELGTVTAQGQPGNDRPRVFRLPASAAVINRMGFNNPGATAVAATLAARGVYRGNGAAGLPVGISIGKTKVVPVEDAVEDYLTSLRILAPHADYLAVNVSSPNTPGLRQLQGADELRALVSALVGEAEKLAEPDQRPLPILVKVAPDLSYEQLDEVVDVASATGASGLIATNTTLARTGLAPSEALKATETGGLSGAPLSRRSLEVVAHLAKRTSLPIIGVGGIMAPHHAEAMFDAGASLVQLYTGFLYGGPALAAGINRLDLARVNS
jgi:dihydroorotate dehydrogenase